jgi:hypothetical protein
MNSSAASVSERHHLGLAVMAIVFPGEVDLAVGEPGETRVCEGDAMGIAAEISQHLIGSGERALGIDHPFERSASRRSANALGSARAASVPEKCISPATNAACNRARNSVAMAEHWAPRESRIACQLSLHSQYRLRAPVPTRRSMSGAGHRGQR